MVFLTGATGYMGRRLAAQLVRRGRPVTALVRQGSETKAPPGCTVAIGDALNASSYRERVSKGCTFVHLVGVAHPSPAKAAEFQAIDLVSIRAAVEAARFADVRHFIYVSVAHPAPVMEAYIAVRTEGESLIRSAGLNATILRPWNGMFWDRDIGGRSCCCRCIGSWNEFRERVSPPGGWAW